MIGIYAIPFVSLACYNSWDVVYGTRKKFVDVGGIILKNMKFIKDMILVSSVQPVLLKVIFMMGELNDTKNNPLQH